MSVKTYNFCNNCGRTGHLFHQCKNPITSLGIICFRKKNDHLEYLLIRRKDSLGYVDFMRGKYPLYNKKYLLNIISEMTVSEQKKLLTNTFEELWEDLWGEFVGIQYRSEEKISREKFSSLNTGINNGKETYTLKSLLEEKPSSYLEPEWGFPKGRRNYNEKDFSCALREFEEETGYSKNNILLLQNIIPIEEIFTGSNYKSYKHKYYIAYIDNINSDSPIEYQESEVSKVQWLSFDECLKIIRPYNLEKQDIIERVDNILKKYSLYT